MEGKEESPDLEELGDAMTRALKVAGKAEALSEKAETLIPKVSKLAGMLGTWGKGLLALIGN